MSRVPREGEIQTAILLLLKVLRIPAWRANTGAFKGEYQGRARFVRFGVKGQADILGLLPPSGRLLALEVKRPGGKLSPHQDAFLRTIRDAGGIGAMVTSCQDVRDVLTRHEAGR